MWPHLELEDGTCISQCTAITEYIDGTFDGPSLCGNDPKERAVVHMMNRRAEAGLVFADFAKVEIPANLTNLIAWRARVSARPSVAG